jgi:hypothetical protein
LRLAGTGHNARMQPEVKSEYICKCWKPDDYRGLIMFQNLQYREKKGNMTFAESPQIAQKF